MIRILYSLNASSKKLIKVDRNECFWVKNSKLELFSLKVPSFQWIQARNCALADFWTSSVDLPWLKLYLHSRK
jgi:hypothetical protein